MIGLAKKQLAGEELSVISGVIVVDKPAEKTSFDVIREVRKSLGIRKIGHTGTLDPIATGVLPLCINEATKMAAFLTDDDKEYRATMELGVKTDTQDITGAVIATRNFEEVTRETVETLVKSFQGTVQQKIPRYSAAKYRGKPYHRWTREGVYLDTPEKEITIRAIDVECFSPPYVTFRVTCSKGTYIRALCDDMGERLGCGAVLAGLRRTRSGSFDEEDALSLDHMTDRGGLSLVKDKIVPLKDVLGDLAVLHISDALARSIRDGCQPERRHLQDVVFPDLERGDLVRFIAGDSDIIAVARMLLSQKDFAAAHDKEQVFKLVRVFNGHIV